MLADLTLVNCYNRTLGVANADRKEADQRRDNAMLDSAKRNLASLAFFALTEYQAESQWLFERTFGLRFAEAFVQYNETRASDANLTVSQVQRLRRVNTLDDQLYDYAKQLFFQRLAHWNYFSNKRQDDGAAAVLGGDLADPGASRKVVSGNGNSGHVNLRTDTNTDASHDAGQP